MASYGNTVTSASLAMERFVRVVLIFILVLYAQLKPTHAACDIMACCQVDELLKEMTKFTTHSELDKVQVSILSDVNTNLCSFPVGALCAFSNETVRCELLNYPATSNGTGPDSKYMLLQKLFSNCAWAREYRMGDPKYTLSDFLIDVYLR
uniref:Uncharacterized protein n=1 Tax=Mucochytrium quahogii TaxID=96639 RepID=A0A7S2SEK8_9STRA|mmetsp:Transcript_7036/g.11181  ORF Transcript_7036/g.11181 Transcript_7036/m.11181 type:complete len:151 (-) Transcript_7036:21-473(-)